MNPKVYSKAIAAGVVLVAGYLGRELAPDELALWVDLISSVAVVVAVYAARNAKPAE